MPPDPTAAAFFEVDNTVMQGAALFHLAAGLYRRDFFTRAQILKAAWQQTYFRLAGVEDLGHVADARSSLLASSPGTGSVSWSGSVRRSSRSRWRTGWPGTRALAQLHLDAGQRVWLVTAAPVEIATIIARRLGLTGALGTVSEQLDGVYTGRLVGELLHGPGRAEPSVPWPYARVSTSRVARRTPTRPTTCRCSRWWATRARSTPMRRCGSTHGTTAGGCTSTAPVAVRPGSRC